MRKRQREKIDAQWARWICLRQYAEIPDSTGRIPVMEPKHQKEMERLGRAMKTRGARRFGIRGMGG